MFKFFYIDIITIFTHKHIPQFKLFVYFLILYTLLIINKFKKIKSFTFLGYKISCSNYFVTFKVIREIFLYEIYFFETNKKTPIIIDAGGHIGLATLYFKYLYPESNIEIYEPSSESCILIKRNIKQNNLKNITLIQSAISDRTSEVELYLGDDYHGGVAHTIEKNNSALFINKNKETEKVNVISLSKILEKKDIVDFLKLDIEGSERKAIIDSAQKNMLNKIAEVVIEYHNPKQEIDPYFSLFIDILTKNNFSLNIKTIPNIDKRLFKKKNHYLIQATQIKKILS